MSATLHPDDRRAIDLLLDRSQTSIGFSEAPVDPERLRNAERLLKVLDLMPADEPPQDLVSRTLSRLGYTGERMMPVVGTGIGAEQAHA